MGALNGKVAIVTCAGQGVGRCHAELLAAEGASVVVNDITELADEVAEAIVAAGGQAVAHHGSVSDWTAAEEMVGLACDCFGELHILVNNAGFIRDAMTFSMTEERFDAVVDVHLKGHFAPAHFAAVYWRTQAKSAGEGAALAPRRIINTSSESGLFGGPGQSNYGSAKGGIVSMTLIQARELGRLNVTANCIAPRARTPMTAAIPTFVKPETGFDKYDPANVSPMVAWLASDDAGDVSGQVFIVLGDEIHRMQPAHIAASIAAGGRRWTVAAINSERTRLFADTSSGIPAWAGPPM